MLEGHRNSHISDKLKKNGTESLYIDDPLRLGEKIKVEDICPSCHSIYVTKGHCESCGLQFGVDVIGEPFGPKSFFTLKDDFDLNLSKLSYLEWRLGPEAFVKKPKVQRYIRHMLKRFENLLSYLVKLDLVEIPENVEASDNHILLFIFEAKEIMKEYQKFSKDLSALFVLLSKGNPEVGEPDAITVSLLDYLYSLDLDREGSSKRISHDLKGLNVSLWEMLKGGIVLEALATIGAITLASYLVMKYISS